MLWLAGEFYAAARGRVGGFLAYADSVNGVIGREPENLFEQALVEPWYLPFASEYAAEVTQRADSPEGSYLDVCYAGWWRVVIEGDWNGVDAAVSRLVASEHDGPVKACPVLLRALVEQEAEPERVGPALDEVHRITKESVTGQEPPIRLLIIPLLERAGAMEEALEQARSRLNRTNEWPVTYIPAYRHLEGRLAAMVGDTAGAIKAYEHYLRLRTDPDPEVVPQVDSVRAGLAALTGTAN